MKNLVYNSDFGAVVYPKNTGETHHHDWSVFVKLFCSHLVLCVKIVITVVMHPFRLLDDVKKALGFVKEHGIRPTVYSSGHDFIGKLELRINLQLAKDTEYKYA